MKYGILFIETITTLGGVIMKVNIVGKNVKVTPAIAEKVNKKLDHLTKYFLIDDNVTAKVLIRTYPVGQKIEVTIPTKYAILRAEVVDDDLYAAIDLAIDKLEDQIRRQKTRLQRKNRLSLAEAFLDEEESAGDDIDEVVKTKSIEPQEMSLDEAIMKMELLGHDFFIYTDDETEKIAVVYKRKDGDYGLIETE
jgi:putative sigma-54 modulation protein